MDSYYNQSSEVYGLFELASNSSTNLDLPNLPDDLLGPVLTSIEVDQEINVQEELIEIEAEETEQKVLKCNSCDEVFATYSKHRTHRYKVHNEK